MRLLRERQFALVFVGSAVDGIGSWAALIALWGFATYRFHAGPQGVAALGLAWSVPNFLLGPFAGVVIDRIGPRRVLVGAGLLGSGAAFAMLAANRWPHLVLLSILTGVAKAFLRPAADALPARIVADEDLLSANALLGAASDSAIVFGPLVAALAIAAGGLSAAFVVDGLTYLVGIAVLIPLKLRTVEQQTRPDSIVTELSSGLAHARQTPVVRWTLLLSMSVYLTWGTFAVVEPIYVRDVLHRSPTVLAMLQVAFGAGLVITGMLLPRLGDRVASTASLAGAVLLSGVAAALYVGTHSLPIAVIGVLLWGVDVAFFAAPSRTLLQRHTPADTHGRIMALNSSLHSLGDVIALPAAGLLAAGIGVQGAGLAVAGLATASGLRALVRPRPPTLEVETQVGNDAALVA